MGGIGHGHSHWEKVTNVVHAYHAAGSQTHRYAAGLQQSPLVAV
jgi:hypothetical protein